MNLSDGDIEFILTIYDTSTSMMEDKAREKYATEFIRHLVDFGFDVKACFADIADHDSFLSDALDEWLEQEEEDEYEEEGEYLDEDDEDRW